MKWFQTTTKVINLFGMRITINLNFKIKIKKIKKTRKKNTKTA